MRLLLSLLGSLLLLLTNIVVAEHHHEDHETHFDCSLCILQHSQIDNTTHKPSPKLNFLLYSSESNNQEDRPEIKLVFKYIHSRAPPLV
ncbi:MAG: hypothetical protein RMK21_07620 [Aquificaceae bacterium]|nr:hypothetical protein [Aquificaceae bacterium]